MKKSLYIILMFVFLGFQACEDDESFDFGTKPTGDFTFEVDTDNSLVISFTPLDVDTANVLLAWDFGIAGEDPVRSVEYEPVIEFPESGNFTVTMVLTNDAGITAIQKELTVSGP